MALLPIALVLVAPAGGLNPPVLGAAAAAQFPNPIPIVVAGRLHYVLLFFLLALVPTLARTPCS